MRYTYDDFKARISISDLLVDAGYCLNRRDGMKYPAYIQVGQDGKRVRGEKFILTANKMCCFRPPEQKNYNIISFIKSFPEKFKEYVPGMDKDRLVNLVCNRMLNNPIIDRPETKIGSAARQPDFDIGNYKVHSFGDGHKQFYHYFKHRGIDLKTQQPFAGHFFLATKKRDGGNAYSNLAFPMSLPAWPGKEIVGLEERGRQFVEGAVAFKGVAAGSNASQGLWIARLENHSSYQGFSTPIGQAKDVYWFESAYDAMAFYQLNRRKDGIGDAVFVSTSGNPTNGQMDGMARETPNSRHYLCFDADEAGEKFANAFLLRHPELKAKRLKPEEPYKDWNEQLLDQLKQKQNEERNGSRGFRR